MQLKHVALLAFAILVLVVAVAMLGGDSPNPNNAPYVAQPTATTEVGVASNSGVVEYVWEIVWNQQQRNFFVEKGFIVTTKSGGLVLSGDAEIHEAKGGMQDPLEITFDGTEGTVTLSPNAKLPKAEPVGKYNMPLRRK